MAGEVPPTSAPSAPPAPARLDFIDWYRGLACVLMFQTHAYDAWTRQPDRGGLWWWMARMQLGGFPARMFLFLAGVSLVLRYASDQKKGIPDGAAQWGAVKRGLEVLGYGLAFRLFSWGFGGARLDNLPELFKVDILNCIGVSLVLCALLLPPRYLLPPRDSASGSGSRSLGQLVKLALPVVASVILVLVTPRLQNWGQPSWLPGPLADYLWSSSAIGSFPLFPWLSYSLTGCVVGVFWVTAAQTGEDRLATVLRTSAVIGAIAAFFGQLGSQYGPQIARPTAAVPMPAYPSSYFYRTGMCLLGGVCAYYFCLAFPARRPDGTRRFSSLRVLGQASLLVYLVHIELVYGFPSWRIRYRFGVWPATALVVLLTVLMIALAYYRVEVFGKRKPKPSPSASRAS